MSFYDTEINNHQKKLCYNSTLQIKDTFILSLLLTSKKDRFHGLIVSTLDSEFSDPSSSLGGGLSLNKIFFVPLDIKIKYNI